MRPTVLRLAQRAKTVKSLPEGFVPRKPDTVPAPKPTHAPAPTATQTQGSSSAAAAAASGDAGVRVGLRPPRRDRTRSVVDSFRVLPSNTRILIGIGLGICGLAGLWFDRALVPEDEAEIEEAKAKLPISLRVVDRKE